MMSALAPSRGQVGGLGCDGPSFKLAHLSDSASAALPVPQCPNCWAKRALGTSMDAQTGKISPRDVSTYWWSDLQAQVPDHIAVTGDLATRARDRVEPSPDMARSVGPPDRCHHHPWQSRHLGPGERASIRRELYDISGLTKASGATYLSAPARTAAPDRALESGGADAPSCFPRATGKLGARAARGA